MPNRTGLILRHEFLTTIKKKGFIILTLAVPVILLLGIGIFRLASSIVTPSAAVTPPSTRGVFGQVLICRSGEHHSVTSDPCAA